MKFLCTVALAGLVALAQAGPISSGSQTLVARHHGPDEYEALSSVSGAAHQPSATVSKVEETASPSLPSPFSAVSALSVSPSAAASPLQPHTPPNRCAADEAKLWPFCNNAAPPTSPAPVATADRDTALDILAYDIGSAGNDLGDDIDDTHQDLLDAGYLVVLPSSPAPSTSDIVVTVTATRSLSVPDGIHARAYKTEKPEEPISGYHVPSTVHEYITLRKEGLLPNAWPPAGFHALFPDYAGEDPTVRWGFTGGNMKKYEKDEKFENYREDDEKKEDGGEGN